jgi:hypothetical protein
MGNANKKPADSTGKDVSTVIVEEDNDEAFDEELKRNLQRLIIYAQGSDPALQREVARQKQCIYIVVTYQ